MSVETTIPENLPEGSRERLSKLSPELQAFVRTPEFKSWFGDWENDPDNSSKIIDENGEPGLVYFGGPAGINELSGGNRTRTGHDERGFYFTTQRNVAKFFAQSLRDPKTDEAKPSSVYSAFLNIKNPYIRQAGDDVKTQRVIEIPEGYDGYINQTVQELVVFDPEQVAFVQEEAVNVSDDTDTDGSRQQLVA